jgi:hypothetical protein
MLKVINPLKDKFKKKRGGAAGNRGYIAKFSAGNDLSYARNHVRRKI